MVHLVGTCTVRHIPSDTLLHILELLSSREACTAALVCRQWHRVISSLAWSSRYSELWQTRDHQVWHTWQLAFAARMAQARSLNLRCTRTSMHGHSKDIKCIAVLASSQLVYTGSYDGTLICWDLVTGTRVGHTLRHGGTVRAVSLDEGWLVSGCSDGHVSAWMQGHAGCATHYDLEAPRVTLARHRGPVSTLQLSRDFVYSGSWDGSVLEVSRASRTVCRSFYLGDWIVGITLLAGRLLVAAGSRVVSSPLRGCGGLAARGSSGSEGECGDDEEEEYHATTSAITSILGCSSGSGSWAILGDESGRLLALDVAGRPAAGRNPRVLMQGLPGAARDAPITSLSWQFPWLLATSRCGAFLLETCEVLGAAEKSPHAPAPATAASVRVLTSQPCRCGTLAGAWVVAADGARGAVWDHEAAAAAAGARALARTQKRSARDARRERAAEARVARLAARRRAAAEDEATTPRCVERGAGAAAEPPLPQGHAGSEPRPGVLVLDEARGGTPAPWPRGTALDGAPCAPPCLETPAPESEASEGEPCAAQARPLRLGLPCVPLLRLASCRAQAAARAGAPRRALRQVAALHGDD